MRLAQDDLADGGGIGVRAAQERHLLSERRLASGKHRGCIVESRHVTQPIAFSVMQGTPRLEKAARARRDGAAHVDAAASILDDHHLEAAAAHVLGRVAHAEVEGEAGEKHPGQPALAQISGEGRRRRVIVLVEGRVRIDLAAVALSQDELGVRDPQSGVELCAGCVLHAVVRPEHLGTVSQLD